MTHTLFIGAHWSDARTLSPSDSGTGLAFFPSDIPRWLDGAVVEVKVWQRALSSGEVATTCTDIWYAGLFDPVAALAASSMQNDFTREAAALYRNLSVYLGFSEGAGAATGAFPPSFGVPNMRDPRLHAPLYVPFAPLCYAPAQCIAGTAPVVDPWLPPGNLSHSPCCTQCTPGRYAVNASTACLDCPIGRFAAAAGAVTCEACPAGSTTQFAGNAFCVAVPAWSAEPSTQMSLVTSAWSLHNASGSAADFVGDVTRFFPVAGMHNWASVDQTHTTRRPLNNPGSSVELQPTSPSNLADQQILGPSYRPESLSRGAHGRQHVRSDPSNDHFSDEDDPDEDASSEERLVQEQGGSDRDGDNSGDAGDGGVGVSAAVTTLVSLGGAVAAAALSAVFSAIFSFTCLLGCPSPPTCGPGMRKWRPTDPLLSSGDGRLWQPPCTACPLGSGSDGGDSEECFLCPSGMFNDQECLDFPVPIGIFPNYNFGCPCRACPANQYAPSENSTHCRQCPTGEQAVDHEHKIGCEACPAGTYLRADANTCDPCPAGKYNNRARQEGEQSCLNCAAGKFAIRGATTCSMCSAGSYNANEAAAQCAECELGKAMGEVGQQACAICAAGRYAPAKGLSSCFSCDVGFFQNATGATSCAGCPSGTFANQAAASVCPACGAGRFAVHNAVNGTAACTLCPAGSWSNTTASACTTCLPGRFAAAEQSSNCTLCPVGHMAPAPGAVSCLPCARGFYQNTTGATDCQPCRSGTASNALGAATCEACVKGTFAVQSGTGGSSSTCTPCGNGTAGPTLAHDACLCAAGYATFDAATGSCSECDAFSFMPLASTGADSCQPCGAHSMEASLDRTFCRCAAGHIFNSTTGDCLPCPVGSVPVNLSPNRTVSWPDSDPSLSADACVACSPGPTNSLQTRCLDCPEWSFTSPADTCGACAAPAEYLYPLNTEAFAVNITVEAADVASNASAPGNSTAAFGPRRRLFHGEIAPSGPSVLTPSAGFCNGGCQPKSFLLMLAQPAAAAAKIIYEAPVLDYEVVGNVIGDALEQYPIFPYINWETVEPTEEQIVVPYIGVVPGQALAMCISCIYWWMHEALFQPVVPRPSGCRDTSWCECGEELVDDKCVVCKAGYWQGGKVYSANKDVRCKPADAGYFVNITSPRLPNGDRAQCKQTACTPGTFQNATGQTACTACQLGSAVDVTAATSCLLCKENFYANTTGLASCPPCPAHTYNDDEGLSECFPDHCECDECCSSSDVCRDDDYTCIDTL